MEARSMSWIRIDDGFSTHRKLATIGANGVTIYIAGLCFCARHATGGRIDKAEVAQLWRFGRVPIAQTCLRLVAAKLWEDRGDHYIVHDYEQYNESADEIQRKRKHNSERQRRLRERRNALHGVTVASTGDALLLNPVSSRLGPDLSLQEDLKTTTGYSPGRDASPAPALTVVPKPAEQEADTALVVGREYARRYEAATQKPWMSIAANHRELAQIGAWARKAADDGDILPPLRNVLDGFFLDEWAQKHAFPLRALAKDPSRYVEAAAKAAAEARAAEYDRLSRQRKRESKHYGDDAWERITSEIGRLGVFGNG
jgi:hypothetical protein